MSRSNEPIEASTRISVVVGNPRPDSRTLRSAVHLAHALTGRDPGLVVDLARIGAGLLDPDDVEVTGIVAEVAASDLVVVASPTYKATYTGLLKLFLDRFAPTYGTGLTGIAVPLMLGAGSEHALAAEYTLRPVLTEIGGLVVTRSLFVLDSRHDDPESYGAWLAESRPVVRALLGATPASRPATPTGAVA
ncbi:NADPH-dependent FMN reductase [Nocardioides sp. R-C-SC26]|uniref:NADPH-dependent FMN reductase n=1 Tax=Nocardioides sp. R-C-SC26 TaxID=2870414 RepID=UPI001E471492|nr:NAD(P)H-dependent oxidoreductase [Nocardioides sp. R-C-SC26]